MPDDDSNNASHIDHGFNNGQSHAIPEAVRSEHEEEWSSSLWDDGWEGEFGSFGNVHLCVATKKWASGAVDVLVAHDPYSDDADDGLPTAYAHRHGAAGATPLTIHGPANLVVKVVTDLWRPPQLREP